MSFYGSFPFDALLLEACQPYYSRYQVPHEQAQKARRCSPSAAPAAPQPAPRFHASETGDAYKLYIALPGLERKDIAINIDEGVLSLEVNRPADPSLDAFRAIPSKLRRTWKMPDAVDASGIRARLTNGELVITLPKAAKMEPRRVLIAGDEDAKAAAPAPAPASAPEPAAPTEANLAAAAAAMDTAPSHDGNGAHGNNGGDPKKNPEARSEEDGSVEDLSDEEREAERAARRRKALAAEAGPVLMDADEAPAVAA